MNRHESKNFIAVILGGAAVAVLSAGMVLAEDQPGQRTDGQIEMDVVHALDGSAPLKNDLITAATIQSEVTLSGTVSSKASKDLAENIVRGVSGVTKVNDNLTVGDPQQAAQQEGLTQNQDQGDDMATSQGPAQSQNQPMPDNSQAADPNAYPQQQQNASPQAGPGQPQHPQARPQYAPPPPGYPQQPQYGQGPQYPQQQPQYPQQQQQYPQQPQYGQGGPQYPRQQPQYPQQPQYEVARGPVTIAPGTLLQLRTSEPVDSKRATDGAPIQFTVIQDVVSGGVLAIPRGATVHGVVSQVKKAGELAGKAELALTLTSLDLGGQTYPLQSDEFKVQSPNKAGETVGNAVAGGLIGTIIGCAAGRGAGCAIGAGAGVAAGTAASAATPGPRAWIPAEAQVVFHLTAPITVNPVGAQEAARLAQGLYPGGPSLYQRGPGPRYYRQYGYPAYGYPPVYYRPYYMVGGAYYWR